MVFDLRTGREVDWGMCGKTWLQAVTEARIKDIREHPEFYIELHVESGPSLMELILNPAAVAGLTFEEIFKIKIPGSSRA